MEKKKFTHLNDRTRKYESAAQASRQHQYFGLPGEFKTRYPQEIVFPNMETGRMDELYSTDQGMLIDLEEESNPITEKTLQKFGRYVIFVSFMYSINVYLAVICHTNPKKLEECYQLSPTVFIRVHYCYIGQNELWDKYDNIISKVQHNIELSDIEALDIAFISKFISKEYAQNVTKSLITLFNNAVIPDRKLKIDVAAILGATIRKHFPDEKTQNRLLEKINMKEYESEMEKIIYEEFGDALYEKDEEIESLSKTIKKQSKELESQTRELESQSRELESQSRELESKNEEIDNLIKFKEESKQKLKKLRELENLDSQEAKSIINSLILL